MKIAMFTDAYWPRVNGVTVSVDTFSRALSRAGHEVMIVCAQYPADPMLPTPLPPGSPGSISTERKNPEQERITILRIPSYRFLFSREDRIAKLAKRRWVEKELDKFEPDVVHVNSEFIIAQIGFWYAKKRRLPAVYTFHTIWEDYVVNYIPLVPEFLLRFTIRRLQKMLLRQSDLVIVPTLQIKEFVKSYHIKRETRLLPTGIDPVLFQHDKKTVEKFRLRLEKKYPILKGRRILLFAGRVAKEKNLSFIIRLFPLLLENHSDLALVIAGNGPSQDYYMEEAQNCGVMDRCVFTGYLERTELSLAYAVSHIFLMPSLTETQGLVTIEAMLSGVPVVAIGAMGTVQLMEGNQGGFMVGNDTEEFKARVLQLLEDEDLYRRKSEEARRHAQKWTIGCLTEQLIEIYRESSRFINPPTGFSKIHF
ncbi:MAG: glycosyltransferase [Spirochaetaceae bacterium]|jgi:glycosyltransferase involved in cell wall biosynthesis|nr:glycosyltransferase [Spirochaetaceae bacterium]